VHVSNFRSVKRPADCIDIVAKAREAGENVRLIMVGDGPERSAVFYRAEQSGVSDNTIFVGKQGNIPDYLGVSDIFLLPSELESFGLAALEAQACELPVIATRIGGIPEVVSDGETGFLSEIGDVEKMAADTIKLLRDDDMRRAFGKRGREMAVERYSTEKIIPEYITFYENVLHRSKTAAA